MQPRLTKQKTRLRVEAIMVLATAITGCGGVTWDFQREFDALSVGASRSQLLSALQTQPLKTVSSDVAGFSLVTDEVKDVKATYIFTFVGTPVTTEPRLVAKTRTPHCNFN